MLFIFFTLFEFAFAAMLLFEVKNEGKLIDFEDRMIRNIRKTIRKSIKNRRRSGQLQLVSQNKTIYQIKKSA